MKLARAIRSAGPRALGLTFAYLFTSLITIAAIFTLRRGTDPAALKFFLGFLFISGLSAGLDPGTAKAAFLRRTAGGPSAGAAEIITLSAAKGAAASLAIGALWAAADPTASFAVLVWALPITVAGFVVTDYRVSLDWSGRHQQAIWLKQGSLALGVAVAAAALSLGQTPPVALLWSTLARLIWTAAFLRLAPAPQRAPEETLRAAIRRLALDPRWASILLMSAISAMSGSMDRIVVLRLLPAHEGGDYFLWFELISKFWLVPYIAGPVIFAKGVRGDRNGGLAPWMIGVTLIAGAAFLIALPLAGALLGGRLPPPFDHVGLPVMLLALGIVLSAVAQLMGPDLQARGRLTYMLVCIVIVLALTPVIFGGAALLFGAAGVYGAWVVKSVLEICLYAGGYRWAGGLPKAA